MTGDELPDAAQVVRYVRPSHIREDGDVDGRAFRLREDETGLSVNWLDYFAGLSKSEQINEVRRFSRLSLSKNGRFAELNVGDVKRAADAELPELPGLRFVHDPPAANGAVEADPSHSLVIGLPGPADSRMAAAVGDLIARRVQGLHPASV